MNELSRSLLAEAWAMEPRHLARFASELVALPAEAEMLAASRRPSVEDMSQDPDLDVRDGVAHIPVRGVVLKRTSWVLDWFGVNYVSTERAARAIGTAIAREDVRAIALDVDSPGGTISGVQELADLVRAARDVKPVSAHISDLGASAAYWIASQASPVTANASAAVGSIGVYTTVADVSRMAENEGVRIHVIASHELKGAGVPGAPVTDAQLADIRRNVQSYADLFTVAVARGRGLSNESALAISTGQVWIGEEARERGLIDAVVSSTTAHTASAAAGSPSPIAVQQNNAPSVGAQEQKMSEKSTQPTQAGAPDAERIAQMEAENAALKASIEAMQANQREQLIASCQASGHIAPAALDAVRKVGAAHGADLAGFEAFLKALPVVTRAERVSVPGTDHPSAEQTADIDGLRSLAKQFGQSEARAVDAMKIGEAVDHVEFEPSTDATGKTVMEPRAVMKDGSRLTRAELRSRLGLKGALAAAAFAVVSMLGAGAQAGALSAARATECKAVGGSHSKAYKMKASTTIYAGSLVMLDSTGLAIPAAASASNNGVVGVAQETKTSAASGTYNIGVSGNVVCKFAGTSLGQEDVGDLVYAEDDQTVDDASGANEAFAGILTDYVSASVGWVYVSPFFGKGIVTADPLSLTGDLTVAGGAGAVTFSGSASSIVVDDNDTTALLIGSTGQLGLLTIDTGNATETVVINGTTTVEAFSVAVGTSTFAEDATFAGGAGAVTLTDSASSVVLPDNDTTALLIGSTDQLNLLTFDTGDNTETVIVTGTASASAFEVAAGTASFAEPVTLAAGAGALTCTSSNASVLLIDNDASALDIGSAGATSLMRFSTLDAGGSVTVTGAMTVTAGLVTTALEADLVAGACTAGTWKVDNGGGTRELCRCNDAGSAYDCISVTTANGPTD